MSDSSAASALSIRHVGKVYMSRQGWTEALDDCSLDVPAARIFGTGRAFRVVARPPCSISWQALIA